MNSLYKSTLFALILFISSRFIPTVHAEIPSITSYMTGKAVIIDGNLDLIHEYAQATSHTFTTRDGEVTFYVHHDGNFLYLGMDVDGVISWGEQILLTFDTDHDHTFENTDLLILWHGDPHGDPARGSGPWIGTGIGLGNQPIPDVLHAFKLRSGGYMVEFAIPMSYFTASPMGFHVRHSPDNNQNYVWEVTGQVQGIFDDMDASLYGHLMFGGFFVIPENPFGTIGILSVMIISLLFSRARSP